MYRETNHTFSYNRRRDKKKKDRDRRTKVEEEEETGPKEDLTKVIGLIVIVLVGLLCGKVFAIGLTLSWCLILRVFCCKSQTSF